MASESRLPGAGEDVTHRDDLGGVEEVDLDHERAPHVRQARGEEACRGSYSCPKAADVPFGWACV